MRLPFRKARRALLILSVVAASAVAALPGSPAAPAKELVPAMDWATARQLVPSGELVPYRTPSAGTAPTTSPSHALVPGVGAGGVASFAPFLLQTAPPPIQTFDADCTTPKTDWNLGNVVCVKVSAPTSAARVLRRVQLVSPSGLITDSIDVTTSPQTVTFTLPSAATVEAFGITFDSRGTWRINLTDTSDATVRSTAPITVHDPAEAVADVQINKLILDSSRATAGSDVKSVVWVFNAGPDAAANVRFTDSPPANTTFQSLTQTSGPTFDCTTPDVGTTGTSLCTRASLANGEAAGFTVTYRVNANVTNSAELTSSASVTSDTTDTNTNSNGADADLTASNPSPPSCTMSCPNNITQDNDPGMAGAIVNYDPPVTSSGCGTVTTDHPSGSFFPIGTTVVTASTSDGSSCSFTVTVEDKRTVSVTLNGQAEMTVECHTGFTDPGATATDGTNSLPVTTTVTVPSGQEDANGDPINPITVPAVDPNSPNNYTITYSATKDGNTATATRIVHVVDTTPPDIILAGTAGFTPQTEQVTVTNDDGTTSTVTETVLVATVECHTSFTAPTATAADSCDNHPVSVTTSGGADVNTPGAYQIVYTASDAAGNDAERRVRVNVVDTTKPVITLNGDNPMLVFLNSTFTDPGATAADGCAGPVPVTANGTVDTSTVGLYTITYSATDPSGNAADTVTRTVRVGYNFTGFFSPVSNPPTLNQVNAGRSVPVKFSLGGNQGLNILAAGSPFSQQVTCGSSNVTDLQETGTAGNSSLSYDPSTNQYIYVWKTESSWAGTCRVLTVKLVDGTSHTANFKFK